MLNEDLPTLIAFIVAVLGFILYFLWLVHQGNTLTKKNEELEKEKHEKT